MENKTKQIQKAKVVAKSAKRTAQVTKHRIHTKVRFFKPRTLRIASKPKYARDNKILNLLPKFDKFTVLRNPLTT
jgi:hypothetical protein